MLKNRVSSHIAEHHQALGQSDAFLALQERISAAAKTDRPVILIGERGTGKELAAARLHLLSSRWEFSYLTLNCASLTESLIESELFGHEAGAFTGAVRLRKGRFEAAHRGTLFLDEVATLPMTVQEKILRVVEYGTMERVGSSDSMKVDVRLIAATNVDLRALSQDGRFRQDLLDRLSFEVIVMPPLRCRREDILPLANHFAREMALELKLPIIPQFTRDARAALLEYKWPGNIRELKNVVERMVYRCAGSDIDQIVFDPFEDDATPRAVASGSEDDLQDEFPARQLRSIPLQDAVRILELWRIRRALEETHYNRRKAALLLGLTYDQLRACLRKYKADL